MTRFAAAIGHHERNTPAPTRCGEAKASPSQEPQLLPPPDSQPELEELSQPEELESPSQPEELEEPSQPDELEASSQPEELLEPGEESQDSQPELAT